MIETEARGPVRKFRLARTLAGRGLYFTAAYWVDGLMVDTGCSHTVRELMTALQGLPVNWVVNTHSHEDHVAGNAAIQRRYGAQIMAHPEALAVMAQPHKNRLRPYQRVMWGYPEPCSARAVGDTVRTAHHTFRVIHAPGHSPDHICLYDAETGWLFTGDAYVGGRDRALRQDYNIWQIIDSLKRLAGLQPQLLFTGSGSIRDRPTEELKAKVAYLEDMGGRALHLQNKGCSRRRIRREILGSELPIAYFTLGHFSGKNLIRSYLDDRHC
jgi:glyoxylase-like metal-dependent hydrolase (beta-lactamase superfamily II)